MGCLELDIVSIGVMKNKTEFHPRFMHLGSAHGPITALRAQPSTGDTVRVSPVALRLGSEMDPCRRDLMNILLSYLVPDSFRPMLGARAWSCKTTNNYLGLSRLQNTSETFGGRCLRLPPGLLMFYITFLLYGLMGLTILDHIYSSFL